MHILLLLNQRSNMFFLPAAVYQEDDSYKPECQSV